MTRKEKRQSYLGYLLSTIRDEKTGIWVNSMLYDLKTNIRIKTYSQCISPSFRRCKDCTHSLLCLAKQQVIVYRGNNGAKQCKCYDQHGIISFLIQNKCFLSFARLTNQITDYRACRYMDYAPKFLEEGLVALKENFSHLKLSKERIKTIINTFECHSRTSTNDEKSLWIHV